MLKYRIPALMAAMLVVAGCGDSPRGAASVLAGGSDQVTGTWSLDTAGFVDAMKKAMLEQAKENAGESALPPEMIEQMMGPMLDRMRNAKMEVEIRGDKTWTGHSEGMGDEDEDVRGTWTRKGSTLELVTTHQGNTERKTPDTMRAEIVGNELHVAAPAGSGMDLKMVLRRK